MYVYAEKNKAQAEELVVNNNYEYEDNDINLLLKIKIAEVDKKNQLKTHILSAVDNITPDQLSRVLRQRLEIIKREKQMPCQLLVPCNLGGYHWVGLLLKVDSAGEIAQAIYCDSLSGGTGVAGFVAQNIKRLGAESKLSPRQHLLQSDTTSCGVLMVENLVALAESQPGLSKKDASQQEIAMLRKEHLQLIKASGAEYFNKFYPRQRENVPTVPELSGQLALHSKKVKFSAREQERIIKIVSLMDNIEENTIKTILIEHIRDQDAYRDNVKAHLDAIRQGFNQVLQGKNISAQDESLIKDLIKEFFGIAINIKKLTDTSALEFAIGHEEIRAISGLYLLNKWNNCLIFRE